jgi:hypothetical protein
MLKNTPVHMVMYLWWMNQMGGRMHKSEPDTKGTDMENI